MNTERAKTQPADAVNAAAIEAAKHFTARLSVSSLMASRTTLDGSWRIRSCSA
jgi:hypothetical protein